jgi:hypothetical protein
MYELMVEFKNFAEDEQVWIFVVISYKIGLNTTHRFRINDSNG